MPATGAGGYGVMAEMLVNHFALLLKQLCTDSPGPAAAGDACLTRRIERIDTPLYMAHFLMVRRYI